MLQVVALHLQRGNTVPADLIVMNFVVDEGLHAFVIPLGSVSLSDQCKHAQVGSRVQQGTEVIQEKALGGCGKHRAAEFQASLTGVENHSGGDHGSQGNIRRLQNDLPHEVAAGEAHNGIHHIGHHSAHNGISGPYIANAQQNRAIACRLENVPGQLENGQCQQIQVQQLSLIGLVAEAIPHHKGQAHQQGIKAVTDALGNVPHQ